MNIHNSNAFNADLGIVPRRRIKPIRQGEIAECGIASLAMIANFHGHDVDLGAMRRRFGVSPRGITLRQLMRTADAMGLAPRPLKVDIADLSQVQLPAILHWDMNHFVVLERLKGGRAYVIDPALGPQWHDAASLSRHYTGVAVEFRSTPGFTPLVDKRSLGLRDLWSGSQGFVRTILQVVILSLVLQTYALAAPYFLQISIDQALPALDGDLVTVLGVGFLLFALVMAGASLLRSFTMLSSGTALSFGITANVARRLLRLPLEWFEKRSLGDVLSRFQSVEPLQKLLTATAPAAVIDGLLALLTLVLMLAYSPLLTAISIGGAAAYAALRFLTIGAQRRAEAAYIIAAGKEQGTMIESLRGIVALRLSGNETMRHAVWQNRLSEALGSHYAHERVKLWQQTGATLIGAVENIACIWLAVRLAMNGGFSVGMIFAFLAYRLQFATATKSLIDTVGDLRMTALHLERLSEIALTPEDRGFSENETIAAPRSFSGRIELRNIVHSYAPAEPNVLQGVSLAIEPGEHVAITGTSGGGKTTLTKIILGLIDPKSGEVLIDGMSLACFGRRAYREHVGAVLQDDSLFAGSIAENVAGFDQVDEDRLREALAAAAILEDIERMPMGTLTLVGDMGSTLSGGQKQRILLARALYRRPRLLVMDEGTAHLDAEHEQAVARAIAAMGMTRIIVAHRHETINAADRVIRIEGGRVVE